MSSAPEGDCKYIVGVLLAAGAGRRFGGPKVLAEGGKWLENSVKALVNGGCHEVVVVLGAAVVAVPDAAVAAVNPAWATGMGSSVRVGLDMAERRGASAVVLHLVDLPDVGEEVVRRVLAADGAGAAALARATYADRPGHPLLVGRHWWPELRRSCVGDEGGRSWLRGHPALIEVPCADLASGIDRDTPERSL